MMMLIFPSMVEQFRVLQVGSMESLNASHFFNSPWGGRGEKFFDWIDGFMVLLTLPRPIQM